MNDYENPILRGMYPDPSIVMANGTYFLVNSTFEYYPGIALSKSTDLVNWEKVESIITKKSQANLSQAESNEGIFAVCIRYYEDKFYVITTNFAEFKNFIIKGTLNDNGTIEWEEERIEIDIRGIDPDLFFEEDKAYVTFTGYIDKKGTKAVQLVEIDLNTGQLIKEPILLSKGSGGRDVEGPHIIKEKNYYYLLMAEGGTGVGHMITMFRSQSLFGPYDESAPYNPIFTNRDRAEESLQNIGHGDLFKDVNGNWWLTCLGTRPAQVGFKKITHLGRETLLYPVLWKEDWPLIYNDIPSLKVDLSEFPEHKKVIGIQEKSNFFDSFSSETLNPEWVGLRGPLKEKLCLRDSKLVLQGSDSVMHDKSIPSFLGIRQTEHSEKFIVNISSDTLVNLGRVGIVSMISNNHFVSIMIKKESDGYDIYRYQQVEDLIINNRIMTFKFLPKTLEIINTPENKKLIAYNDSERTSFETSSIHISNEAIAALNTGTIEGVYVEGNSTLIVDSVIRKMII